MPDSGLRQDMLNNQHRLETGDVIQAGISHPKIPEIWEFYIAHSIQVAFDGLLRGDRFKMEDWSHLTSALQRPKLQPVPLPETREEIVHHQTIPVRPVMVNESTNEGMIRILDEVMINQLGFDEDDEVFKSILFLIHGDQKTVDRMRGVQRLRGDDHRPYDRMQWYLPCLGLWHTRFNYLHMIHQIHWSSTPSADDSTLQANAAFWGRKTLENPKIFRSLEELEIHSFQARITALFMRSVTLNNVAGRTEDALAETVARELKSMPESVFRDHVKNVYDAIHTKRHRFPDGAVPDKELHNHLLYIRNMFPYILLRDSIKFADIGLMRIAIAYLCVMYQGSSHPRYRIEFLRLTRLVCASGACQVPLQDAILTNSLVNKRNLPDSHFEKDLDLEHHNRLLKEYRTHNRTSSLPAEFILGKASLTAPQTRILNERLGNQLNRRANTFHPRKSASEDVLTLAKRLLPRSVQPTRGRDRDFEARDLMLEGIKAIESCVQQFNQLLDRDLLAAQGLAVLDKSLLDRDDIQDSDDEASITSEQGIVRPLIDSDDGSDLQSIGSSLDNVGVDNL